MELKDYFHNKFKYDLRRIVVGKRATGFEKEYIFFGGHEWSHFAHDMQVIPQEERHPLFILSLFMIILTDQALYTYEKDLYPMWRQSTGFPNFGHWGFGPHNENPLWILAKAGTHDELRVRTIELIPEFVKFLIEETERYFEQIFATKIDMSKYFTEILNDNAYKISSHKPEAEELRNSQSVATFKKCFEDELKNKGFI